MGIRQEKRLDAPQVSVKETDYGATFVNVATETKIDETVTLPEPEEETEQTFEDVKPVEKPKRKGGRPKKQK